MSADRELLAGIDYGKRRIGIAVSDGLGLTAQPLMQIEVSGFDDAVGRVSGVLGQENISKVIYGLPRNMDGSEGPMAQEVRKFAESIYEKCSLPYEFFDERLTSVQARAVLREMNISKKKKKKKLDIVSAQILLQCYMDLL